MNIKFLSENLAGQFAKSLAKCVKQEERVAHCGLHIIIIIVTSMQCNGLRMLTWQEWCIHQRVGLASQV